MISAWARICKIIGPDFVAYLPFVVQPLIQAASIKPEIAIVDCKSMTIYMLYWYIAFSLFTPPLSSISFLAVDAEQNYSEDDGWEFITLADQVDWANIL